MRDDWNRCSVCGQFIGLTEFVEKTAVVKYGYTANGDEAVDVYHVKCDEPSEST